MVTPFWTQKALRGVYRHYGTTKIDYWQEVIDHSSRQKRQGKMIDGLISLYLQLGYYSDRSAFEEPVFDPLMHGTFTDFSQSEFVGIDSTLPDEK